VSEIRREGMWSVPGDHRLHKLGSIVRLVDRVGANDHEDCASWPPWGLQLAH